MQATDMTVNVDVKPYQFDKLAGALSKAQSEIKHAVKDATNPHFKAKYADLASVLDACREPLTKHELAISQSPKLIGVGETSEWILVTKLMHSSGQWIESECPILASNDNAQGFGSGLTYARRYALSALVGIAQDDDDGEAATANPPKKQYNAPQAKPTDPVSKYQLEKLAELTTKKQINSRMPELLKFAFGIEKSNQLTSGQFMELFSVLDKRGIEEAFVHFTKEPK